MPGGDVFSPLGRGYATAGRQFALGLPPEEAAEELATAERQRLGLGDGPMCAL